MISLTEEQKAVVRANIAEAEAALHKLMTGQVVQRVVDQNGEAVTFAGGLNRASLRAYIAELKAKLPDEYPCEPKSQPFGFIFGRVMG